jgi:cytochrome b subunit of formate dehydrogenase
MTKATQILRFNFQQRAEHFVTMAVFALLCLTGLPQKFFQTGWAHALVDLFGGIDRTRWLHRFCGVVLALSTVIHFANAAVAMWSKKVGFSMAPVRKDFEDAILQLRFYLGLTDRQPRYDRYDYKQKFEYWGLVFGNVIMVVTGFILFQRGADGVLRHHHLAHLQRPPEPGRLPLRPVDVHG